MLFCRFRCSDVLRPCRCPHIPDDLKSKPGKIGECLFATCGTCLLQTSHPGIPVEEIYPERVLETRQKIITDAVRWRIERSNLAKAA